MTDHGGLTYVGHLVRVAHRLQGMWQPSDDVLAAALLHDLLEDTKFTVRQLRAEGFSDETIRLVQILTHRESESYEEYINRVCMDKWAARIKYCDIQDNILPWRCPDGPKSKYASAFQKVCEVI